MLYHVDRFHAAVSVLAGHGNIKQRLMTAYERHLDEIGVEELPVAVKQDFADLRSLMYRVAPLKGESPISASVRKMSVDEASDCAVQVVALYREIMRRNEDDQAVLPLEREKRKAVPPFLIKTS